MNEPEGYGMKLTPASEIESGSPEDIAMSQAIRDAALQVLPEEWRVLPDGRATHSVLAKATLEIYSEATTPDRSASFTGARSNR